MSRRAKFSKEELEKRKEKFNQKIASSIAGIIKLSLNDQFRRKCYIAAEVDNSSDLEVAIKKKLDIISRLIPAEKSLQSECFPITEKNRERPSLDIPEPVECFRSTCNFDIEGSAAQSPRDSSEAAYPFGSYKSSHSEPITIGNYPKMIPEFHVDNEDSDVSSITEDCCEWPPSPAHLHPPDIISELESLSKSQSKSEDNRILACDEINESDMTWD